MSPVHLVFLSASSPAIRWLALQILLIRPLAVFFRETTTNREHDEKINKFSWFSYSMAH